MILTTSDPSGLDANHTMWLYNSLDCAYTREVGEVSAASCASLGLTEVDKFQHRLFHCVLKAMLRGVKVDDVAKSRMGRELLAEENERTRWLREVLGFDLNPRSPKQMQEFFYGDLKLPIVWKKRPDGKRTPTLDDSALEHLCVKQPLIRPIVRRIQELRSIGVFQSNFIEARLDEDGRMRCSYNICGTESFRFSSSKNAFGNGTNLQTIPPGGAEDDSDLVLPNVRQIFVPDDGMTWFDLDLSKADLYVVVWESDCREMKAMLAEGRDPYVETAREYYRDPTITKKLPDGSPHPTYRTFKSFSHGTHYLGTPHGLSQRLGLTIHEADKAQKWYFGKYPEIPRWQRLFAEEVKRTHRVSNKFGYIRVYLDRVDDSTVREAIAWVPQSTVGRVINSLWVAIDDELPWAEVLLQVHDSLDGQFPTERREEALDGLRRLGAGIVVPYDDPLTIPIGIKTSERSWGDCA